MQISAQIRCVYGRQATRIFDMAVGLGRDGRCNCRSIGMGFRANARVCNLINKEALPGRSLPLSKGSHSNFVVLSM